MRYDNRLSRREALRYLGLVASGLVAGACTPLRIITHAYPHEFTRDTDLVERVLRAFVATVIPGAAADDPNLIRAHLDPRYPFAGYAAFFASDLTRRSAERFGSAFDRLTRARRTDILREALGGDGTTRKLYQGAIYLAQIAYYGGIYDDDAGCALIDFPGRYQGDAVTYDNGASFLAHAATANGNYA